MRTDTNLLYLEKTSVQPIAIRATAPLICGEPDDPDGMVIENNHASNGGQFAFAPYMDTQPRTAIAKTASTDVQDAMLIIRLEKRRRGVGFFFCSP